MTGLTLLLVFAASALSMVLIMAPTRETALVRQRAIAIRRPAGRRPAEGELTDEEMTLPFTQRVLSPLLDKGMSSVLKMTPHKMQDDLQQKLAQAGNPMSPGQFLGLQTTLVAGVALLGTVALSGVIGRSPAQGVLFLLILVVLGWRAPMFWLSRQVTTRRHLVDRALPDVLDLLSVSVEAGLGLDGAIQKVGEKFPEPTAGEFRELLKQIRLGSPRTDALRALAERTQLPDMRTFTAAVIQAEQLGVSISRVLKNQSEALRVRRKQKVEEKAMALPVKMLFPLILFIFPTIFIVVLGPMLIGLMGSFIK